MSNDSLLSELKVLVDSNKRVIEYGDTVVDVSVLYRFILENMEHEE